MIELDLQIGEGVNKRQLPKEALIKSWVEKTIQNPECSVEVTIRIVDEEEMTELNQTYRHKTGTTNVLAFPSDVPEQFIKINFLGDIVACEPVIRDEAQQQKKTISNHWAHMLVHAMLHLQGFDHQQEQDTNLMEAEEVKILAQCNIANPYQLIGTA